MACGIGMGHAGFALPLPWPVCHVHLVLGPAAACFSGRR
jgi:hypothetical protein